MINQTLPIPAFFDPLKVDKIWQVPYQERAIQAREWAKQNNIRPAASDSPKVCFVGIDIQNTFCMKSGELFVGGRSGVGAIEDNVRLCRYLYENMCNLTQITMSLDTHRAIAIFHETFWINDEYEHPQAGITIISANDIKTGVWKVNPAIAGIFGGNYIGLQRYALDYLENLEQNGKYALLIWPFHAMLGGVGHALVSSVEEAVFTHSIVRNAMTDFQIKGGNPLSEEYGLGGAEVRNAVNKAQKNTEFLNLLLNFDMVIITGQASSHCVKSSIENLLEDVMAQDPSLAKKAYILRDCSSPVVIPGVIDFTDQAEEAFAKFSDAGMNLITTQTPIYELV